MVKVEYVADLNEAGQRAFDLVKESVLNGARVLGLATGSSPIRLYELLAQSDLDLSQVISVNLDEYIGLESSHPQSYHYFMNEHLFSKKTLKASFLPDGMANEEKAVSEYERILKENPIDVQILGIGRNGHIGFNEPGTSFNSRTHKVALTQSTIDANTRFFENSDQVPKFAYTMGLENILEAKKIILIACGENKAKAIHGLVKGDITELVPASILQKHNDVIVLIDEAAGSLL